MRTRVSVRVVIRTEVGVIIMVRPRLPNFNPNTPILGNAITPMIIRASHAHLIAVPQGV